MLSSLWRSAYAWKTYHRHILVAFENIWLIFKVVWAKSKSELYNKLRLRLWVLQNFCDSNFKRKFSELPTPTSRCLCEPCCSVNIFANYKNVTITSTFLCNIILLEFPLPTFRCTKMDSKVVNSIENQQKPRIAKDCSELQRYSDSLPSLIYMPGQETG